MGRHVLTVPLAAAFGSLTATLILAVLTGEPGALGGRGPLIAILVMSMFFSLPGAAMLLGLAAILTDRGWPTGRRNTLLLTVGAVAGFGSLGLISGWDAQSSATGALFALTTGTMLLITERLWPQASRLTSSAARLSVIGGATLLLLVTLSMMPT